MASFVFCTPKIIDLHFIDKCKKIESFKFMNPRGNVLMIMVTLLWLFGTLTVLGHRIN